MKLNKLLVILIIPFFISCTASFKLVNKFTKDSVKDTKISIQSTRNMLKVWPYRSGIIKGIINDEIDKYPIYLHNIFLELDILSKKYLDKNITDEELGKAHGLFIRLLIKGSQEVFRKNGINIRTILGL